LHGLRGLNLVRPQVSQLQACMFLRKGIFVFFKLDFTAEAQHPSSKHELTSYFQKISISLFSNEIWPGNAFALKNIFADYILIFFYL
jgi:hypothetical protein